MSEQDELRARCEAFLIARPMSIPTTEEPECVDALVAFASQQRVDGQAEGLREAAALIVDHERKPHLMPLGSLAKVYNSALRDSADLCERRAAELAAGNGGES